MLTLLYIHEYDSLLGSIIQNQVNQANLEGYPTESLRMTDKLADQYQLTKWHNFLYLDSEGTEVHRVETSFNSEELESNLQYAKGVLANRQRIQAGSSWKKEGDII